MQYATGPFSEVLFANQNGLNRDAWKFAKLTKVCSHL